MRFPTPVIVALLGLAPFAAAEPPATPSRHEAQLDPRTFKVVEQDSGPVSYYSVVTENGARMIRAHYRPGLETVVLGTVVPDQARQRVTEVGWRWRARALPKDSNDCGPGFADSAAAVFLTFKSGLKYLILKYVWTSTGTVGTSCQSKRGWFVDRDTILLQVGGPLDTWRTEQVDPRAEFARHFGGKPEDAPDLVGIGLMTDGDQSSSVVEADYADFIVRW